jgi:hypothetical protein
VVNGDMALNSRLASYLYAFRFAPRVAKFWLYLPRGQKGDDWFKSVMAWLFFALWLGIALSIVTFPQFVGARLLQAAISRERQRLADASAIQFTRNPEALKGLLIKALALGTVSPTSPPIMDDLAQTCFAGPVKRRFLDTHQPLALRLRLLDAGLTPARIAQARREAVEDYARQQKKRVAELEQRDAAAAAAAAAQSKRAEFVRETVSAVSTVAALAKIREQPVAEVGHAAVSSADDARAALIALLLDRQPEAQRRQIDAVRKRFGDSSMPAFHAASAALGPLIPAQRSLALDKHLPSVRALSVPELRRLAAAIVDLEEADDSRDVFEYALSREAGVFIADLLEPRDPHGKSNLATHTAALRVLFSVVAQYGSKRDAAAAFEAGMKAVGLESGPRFAPLANWTLPLDQALAQLESLRPIAKELMLEALQATVKFDGEVSPAERELIRLIASSLHCPIPRT